MTQIDGNYCWSAISGKRIGNGQPLMLFTNKEGFVMVRKPEEDPKEFVMGKDKEPKKQAPSVTSEQVFGNDTKQEVEDEELVEEVEEEEKEEPKEEEVEEEKKEKVEEENT